MRTVTLQRYSSKPEGTFGNLETDDGFTCATGELPWRDNQHDISCIPEGVYTCKWLYSPKHGTELYHVMSVPDRGNVEIHSGNWCGDTSLGYKSDVLGCIILGARIVPLKPYGFPIQLGVTNSVATLALFESHMNQEDFQLTIKEQNGSVQS